MLISSVTVLVKYSERLQLLVQFVRMWACYTFQRDFSDLAQTSPISCWHVRGVEVQLSRNWKRSYDWLTASERKWSLSWASRRSWGGTLPSLGTSAWEASFWPAYVTDSRWSQGADLKRRRSTWNCLKCYYDQIIDFDALCIFIEIK